MTISETNLNISEIFFSIQGEGTHTGLPCIFIRLAGCNLNCRWCDTKYARSGGEKKTIEEIFAEIKKYPGRLVMVTGGEPLHQEGTAGLLSSLIAEGYQVLLNTNGSYTLSGLPKNIIRCIDIKCPGSGESDSFLLSNVDFIHQNDEINFVISNREDFDWASSFVNGKLKDIDVNIFFTPAYGMLSPQTLAEWLLNSKNVKIRLGIQLHKIIWGEKRGV